MASERRPRRDSAAVVVRRGILNQARWDEILRSAADEFHQKGYKAARLQDIAARVGLLTGSLYYYIESKEHLLFALIDSTYRTSLDTLGDAEDAARPAPERLRAFVHGQLRILEESRSGFAQVVEREAKFLSPAHRAQVDQLRAQLRGYVEEIFRQGIADGDFDPEVDVEVATSTLFVLVNATSEWAPSPGVDSWDTIGDWYLRLFLSALRVRSIPA